MRGGDVGQYLPSSVLMQLLSKYADVAVIHFVHKVDCHLFASNTTCSAYKSAVFDTEGR
jgi:hypothetical protein